MPNAIEDIAAERRRQIEVEGWTPEHDDGHTLEGRPQQRSSLASAAACYAIGKAEIGRLRFQPGIRLWPWDDGWWKPSDTRRDLVKAAALIVAEIERLDRVQAKGEHASVAVAEAKP